jgi:hypothetical protein
MEQGGAAAADPCIMGLTKILRLTQDIGPINRLLNQDCLFLQVCLDLLELDPALMWINDVLENCQANGVTDFEPMPWSERERPAVTLHEGGRIQGTPLVQIERDDETGIRVCFQKVPRL